MKESISITLGFTGLILVGIAPIIAIKLEDVNSSVAKLEAAIYLRPEKEDYKLEYEYALSCIFELPRFLRKHYLKRIEIAKEKGNLRKLEENE